MRKTLKTSIALVAAAVSFSAPEALAAFGLAAATRPSPEREIVLTWPEKHGWTHFNLYRKEASAGSFPTTPLNAAPITIMTDAVAITAVVPVGSDEWKLMKKAFEPQSPLAISSITRSSEEFARLQWLMRGKWRIAVVGGQGYVDSTVAGGVTYDYELRAVKPGEELPLGGVRLKAGAAVSIPAPANLVARAGDSKVMLTWDDVPRTAGFNVYRHTAATGTFQRISNFSLPTKLTTDLDGDALVPSKYGFIDVRRWDEFGNPDTHEVVTSTGTLVIDGPENGTNYFYKVVSVDLLDQEGSPTPTPVDATPLDTTPPKAPIDVQVTARDAAGQIEIRWMSVHHDVLGHAESGIAEYRVYRFEVPNDPHLLTAVHVAPSVPQPATTMTLLQIADSGSALRPPFGEKVFWYRVECEDSKGNVGARSAAVAGHLSDIKAPAPPVGLMAEGFEDFIRLSWILNTEPDMDGYMIYRSLCHFGEWEPCQSKQDDEREKERELPKACSGPFVLVGTLSQMDALSLTTGPLFEDRTVPSGSPLCYAYLIKAQDQAQNESGSWPVPDPHETIVCQRLRDKTPPEPAIISGLFAQDTAVLVEWIGPPVQDIGAYHVYRGDRESGPYTWVGGATVETRTTTSAPLSAPFVPSLSGCVDIPLIARDDMSSGSFLDTKVRTKTIYWYKVVGVDQVGNEATLDDAVAVSTFTFTTVRPAAPTIVSVTLSEPACGLLVRWVPSFDSRHDAGYAIYRSRKVAGPYRQLGSMIRPNEYLDTGVAAGIDYWYKVVRISRLGRGSPFSAAHKGRL